MRPRLTRKVIRGLAGVAAASSIAPGTHDAGVAVAWIGDMQRWAAQPRRRGAMPPHFQKMMKKRRRG